MATQPCTACRGKGTFERINAGPAPCRTCGGSGRMGAGTTHDPCSACAGQGMVACAACQGRGRCQACAGRGFRPMERFDDAQLEALRAELAAPAAP